MTCITTETIDQYHANQASSSSKITAFIDRGASYFAGRFVTRTIPAPAPTEALIDGNVFDCMVTEDARTYASRYVIKPEGVSLGTTQGKLWRSMMGLDVEGCAKVIVPHAKHDNFLNMRSALYEHPIASLILDAPNQVKQATFRIRSEKYGQDLQVRPDFASTTPLPFSDGLAWSANLKTTADLNDWFDVDDPEGPRSCAPIYGWDYHRQASLDQFVLFQHPEFKQTMHFLVVVEKQIPHRVAVVQMTDDYLEAGFQVVDMNLRRIGECYRTGHWPKSPALLIRATPPQWLLDKAVRQSVAAVDAGIPVGQDA